MYSFKKYNQHEFILTISCSRKEHKSQYPDTLKQSRCSYYSQLAVQCPASMARLGGRIRSKDADPPLCKRSNIFLDKYNGK